MYVDEDRLPKYGAAHATAYYLYTVITISRPYVCLKDSLSLDESWNLKSPVLTYCLLQNSKICCRRRRSNFFSTWLEVSFMVRSIMPRPLLLTLIFASINH